MHWLLTHCPGACALQQTSDDNACWEEEEQELAPQPKPSSKLNAHCRTASASSGSSALKSACCAVKQEALEDVQSGGCAALLFAAGQQQLKDEPGLHRPELDQRVHGASGYCPPTALPPPAGRSACMDIPRARAGFDVQQDMASPSPQPAPGSLASSCTADAFGGSRMQRSHSVLSHVSSSSVYGSAPGPAEWQSLAGDFFTSVEDAEAPVAQGNGEVGALLGERAEELFPLSSGLALGHEPLGQVLGRGNGVMPFAEDGGLAGVLLPPHTHSWGAADAGSFNASQSMLQPAAAGGVLHAPLGLPPASPMSPCPRPSLISPQMAMLGEGRPIRGMLRGRPRNVYKPPSPTESTSAGCGLGGTRGVARSMPPPAWGALPSWQALMAASFAPPELPSSPATTSFADAQCCADDAPASALAMGGALAGAPTGSRQAGAGGASAYLSGGLSWDPSGLMGMGDPDDGMCLLPDVLRSGSPALLPASRDVLFGF